MISKTVLHLLPFLLPFAAYFLIVLLTRRARSRGTGWTRAPWYWLTVSGLALVVAGFLFVGIADLGEPDGRYVPAHYDADGNFVPAHIE